MVRYLEVQCKKACHRVGSNGAYEWDLNPYRGCSHGCVYCFALYSHDYLGTYDHARDIFVKTNIAQALEQQLSWRGWDGGVINLGGVTDAYQPAEDHFKLMPQVLEVLLRHNQSCTLSTKSALPLRDLPLWAQLAGHSQVIVAASIITVDESLAKTLEPGAATVQARLEMLRQMKTQGIATGIHAMPVLPYLTDREDQLEALFEQAAQAGVDYLLCGGLNLKGPTRARFYAFLQSQPPEVHQAFHRLYNNEAQRKTYKKEFLRRLQGLYRRYGLSPDWRRSGIGRDRAKKPEQIRLWVEE